MRNDGSLLALGLVALVAGAAAFKQRSSGSAKKTPRISGWTDDGEPIYASRKRPPRFKGRSVNPVIALPKPPGPWVDDERCSVCGADYDDHKAGVTFDAATTNLRAAAGGFAEGGGYRSRGPVLHMMRVMKLADWYQTHAPCGYAMQSQRHVTAKQRREAQRQELERQQRQRRAMQVPLRQVPF